MLESRIEAALRREVEGRGGLCRKWVAPGHTGVPDRIVILRGMVWFVELKQEDGKLSPMQIVEQKKLMDAGAAVVTLYGMDSVRTFLNVIDPKPEKTTEQDGETDEVQTT